MQTAYLLNASPRAPRSNSKGYLAFLEAALQQRHISVKSGMLLETNHDDIASEIEKIQDLVVVFPLYVDSIPCDLLAFLELLVAQKQVHQLHVIINCGFLESKQNNIALQQLQFFTQQAGWKMGTSLSIGSGEAILGTPFKSMVEKKTKKMARAMVENKPFTQHVQMPLPKFLFLKASTNYWTKYGARFGVDPQGLAEMKVEPK
ncbi:MAG: hypothetical protein ACRCZJ_07470 [Erysipelotrichaceae bacterium]